MEEDRGIFFRFETGAKDQRRAHWNNNNNNNNNNNKEMEKPK